MVRVSIRIVLDILQAYKEGPASNWTAAETDFAGNDAGSVVQTKKDANLPAKAYRQHQQVRHTLHRWFAVP